MVLITAVLSKRSFQKTARPRNRIAGTWRLSQRMAVDRRAWRHGHMEHYVPLEDALARDDEREGRGVLVPDPHLVYEARGVRPF